MGLEEINRLLLEHGRMVTLVAGTAQPLFTGAEVTSVTMGATAKRKLAPAEDFAGRLDGLMKEQDLNAADLARICSITRQGVGRWLSSGGISPVHLFKISRHLNVNPEWLATGVGKRQRAPQCIHDDIPEKDIDLIRAFGMLLPEFQQQVRGLVENLPKRR